MSLIPSESYSFPDHFTRTITYCRDPKEEKEEEKECVPLVEQEVARKKGAIPWAAIPEARAEEDFLPLTPPAPSEETTVSAPPPKSVPLYVTPDLMAEGSVAPPATDVQWGNSPFAPTIARDRPQQSFPPIAMPVPPLRKGSDSATLNLEAPWKMPSIASEPTTPVANNGGPQIDPMANGADQKITAAKPTRPAPPPRVVQAPPPHVVQAPSPDLIQVLFSRAAETPAHAIESVAPAANVDNRQTLPRKIATDAPRPTELAVTLNQEFNFEAPSPYPERRRRSAKFSRFVLCESVAIGILIPFAILGLGRVFRDPTLILLVDILTITAAVTAALIPIIFFALAPTLPRREP